MDYLLSLRLAHNDINPDNIMVKNGAPVLIDFGSCQPFGKRLQPLGAEGWYEGIFFTSELKHDLHSMKKLREWLRERKRREDDVEVHGGLYRDLADRVVPSDYQLAA